MFNELVTSNDTVLTIEPTICDVIEAYEELAENKLSVINLGQFIEHPLTLEDKEFDIGIGMEVIKTDLKFLDIDIREDYRTFIGFEGILGRTKKILGDILAAIRDAILKLINYIKNLILKVWDFIVKVFTRKDNNPKKVVEESVKKAEKEAKKRKENLEEKLEEIKEDENPRVLNILDEAKKRTLESMPMVMYYISEPMHPRNVSKFLKALEEIHLRLMDVVNEGTVSFILPRTSIEYLSTDNNMENIIKAFAISDSELLSELLSSFYDKIKTDLNGFKELPLFFNIDYASPMNQRAVSDIRKLFNIPEKEVIVLSSISPTEISFLRINIPDKTTLEKHVDHVKCLMNTSKLLDGEKLCEIFSRVMRELKALYSQFSVTTQKMTFEDVKKLGFNLEPLIEDSDIPTLKHINEYLKELAAFDAMARESKKDATALKGIMKILNNTETLIKLENNILEKLSDDDPCQKTIKKVWIGYNELLLYTTRQVASIVHSTTIYYRHFIFTTKRISRFLTILTDYYVLAKKV